MAIENNEDTNFNLLIQKENVIYTVVKRLFDVSLSFIGLLFLIPVFILISFLIKINDPKGSVFFIQERVGKNLEIFKMYKFRSMYSNAEERLEELLKFNEIDGAMFKMKDDPRITRIGKYLRESSLDELPQLLNVLKGNMSLVGPRPPLLREVEEYSTYDKQRLMVKPGITGLWQISGRNALSFKEMVELDLQYIREVSLINDTIILFKTIKVIIKRTNAY